MAGTANEPAKASKPIKIKKIRRIPIPLGSFNRSAHFTIGFNRKNRNPEIKIGAKMVEKKIKTGSNTNEILVLT